MTYNIGSIMLCIALLLYVKCYFGWEVMTNDNLKRAKKAKNDEFYTQWCDIEKEIMAYIAYNPDVFKGKTVLLPCDDPEWSNFTKFFAQNFEVFGLKKLISTSYAFESKNIQQYYQPTLFEQNSPMFDIDKSKLKGKIFTLERDINANGVIDIEDLEWQYLDGDGDFRSDEVKKLRDEADIIITNPPFSLFREFLSWIFESDKKFIIIGHQNAITCREVFPLIRTNQMWLGIGFKGGASHFLSDYKDYAIAGNHVEGMIRVSGVVWFTNLEHGKRHQPLKLMSMADNIKHSKHKEIRGREYQKYDNFDGIEVPFTDAIPDDYNGVMGVPISFLDKYCPEQFEIIGLGNSRENFTPTKDYINPKKHTKDFKVVNGGAINCVLAIETIEKPVGQVYYTSDNSKYLIPPYARVLIKKR